MRSRKFIFIWPKIDILKITAYANYVVQPERNLSKVIALKPIYTVQILPTTLACNRFSQVLTVFSRAQLLTHDTIQAYASLPVCQYKLMYRVNTPLGNGRTITTTTTTILFPLFLRIYIH